MPKNTTSDDQNVEVPLKNSAGMNLVGTACQGHERDLGGSGEDVFSRMILYLMALVLVLVAVAGAITFYRDASLLKIPHGAVLPLSMLVALSGLVLATVLVSLGSVLSLQTRQVRATRGIHNSLDRLRGRVDEAHRDMAGRLALLDESLRNLPALPSSGRVEVSAPPLEAGSGDRMDSALGPQVVELLAQMRDFTLMNDDQRKVASDTYWQKKKVRLEEVVRQHIQRREWRRASERIEEMLAVDPNDSIGRKLSQHVMAEKKAEVDQVVRDAQNRLGEWISIGEWDKVRELRHSLCEHYADEPAVLALADQVRKEEHAARKDEIHRLFTTLKEATEHRQWQRAWICARQLIDRYPDDKMVEQMRVNLPTLEQNARIQERKEDEAMFQDLLHRQRYEEALEVANRMVEKFPDSPAAAELQNRMIPKVQELAKQDRLKRQQTSGKETG